MKTFNEFILNEGNSIHYFDTDGIMDDEQIRKLLGA